jgi:hypothetical protein
MEPLNSEGNKGKYSTKKYYPTNSKPDIISEEYFKEEKPEYLCSFCNVKLGRLRDRSGNNPSYYCTRCNVGFDPELEHLQKEPSLDMPDDDIEPAITSIDVRPDVSIRHEPELRGGFSELAKKGTIKFTSYNTNERE